MMLPSEFAERNPRAVVDAVENAARGTWRELQRCRRELRSQQRRGLEKSWWHDYKKERAQHEAETLRLLLAIRGGDW